MLAIRLQRQGHTGYPVYRVIVQDAKHSPSSGKVVAFVGTYNPHTKENKLDIEKIEKYLSNGAQPTPRVVKLLIENKVKLPEWVEKPRTDMAGKTRNIDKLRKNQPKEEEKPAEAPVEAPAEEAEEVSEEKPTETPEAVEEKTESEAPAEENTAEEKPAE